MVQSPFVLIDIPIGPRTLMDSQTGSTIQYVGAAWVTSKYSCLFNATARR